MTIDVEVPPYRVEWRANLTTRWLLISTAGTREDADGLARGALRNRGYCRLISQPVIASRERPDNIIEFRRLYRGRRIPCHAGVALRVCEDFSDRFENVAVSGLNYQMFVPAETPVPFYVNVHVYSCVAPQTPILCADLAWRAAGTLRPGDRVVAFDEDPIEGDGRAARRYRTATIERNDPEVKSCRRVETDVGDPIVASDEHPWLVYRDGRLRWVETEDLHVGDQLAHLARPWERDESHEGGWIAGIFDGEGSMVIRQRETARTYSVAIGIAQREGPVLDRLRAALARRGYSVWMGDGDPEGRGGTHLRGGFAETLRFAGQFRPTRIVERTGHDHVDQRAEPVPGRVYLDVDGDLYHGRLPDA
jgi:hypothetical protein